MPTPKRYQVGGLVTEDEGGLGALQSYFESVSTTTPEAQEAARGILSSYLESRKSGERPGSEIIQRLEDQAEQTRQALRDARERIMARRRPRAEALLAVSAGFGTPTRTGAFGETLGNVSRNLIPALQNLREFDTARDDALLGIDQGLAGADSNVLAAQLRLEELERAAEARLAQEALKTLGRRTVSASSSQKAQEIAEYYRQLLPLMNSPQEAYNRAVNLAYGRERLETVEGLGVVRGLNDLTGEAWEVPLSEARKSGLIPPFGERRDRSETPELDERQTPRVIRDEVPEGDITLWDAALYGTGPWSALRAGYNIAGGWIGLPRARRTTLARQALRSETADFIRSLIPNDRMPVGWVERIERDVNFLPRVLDNPSELRDRMITIDNTLRRRYQQAMADAEDVNLPFETREAQKANAAAIRRFLPVLGVPEAARLVQREAPESSTPGGPPEVDLSTFDTSQLPPEIGELWEYMSEEEQIIVLEELGLL